MIERLLTRLFPTQQLPFGRRWRIFGNYLSPDTDNSKSLLKRGLPWPFKDCGVYVHKITQTDTDRHLHGHPYNFGSFVLSGGQCQGVHTPDGVKNEWVRPFEYYYMPRERYHRVQYLPGGACWTLFFAGKPKWMIHPDTRTPVHLWGFNVDGKFMDWVTYGKRYRNV